MASKKIIIAKRIKYILMFIYILEFIYIYFMPELMALYIYVNTVIQGFIILYLIRDKPTIIIKNDK